MSNADEFLDLYNNLEELLNVRYSAAKNDRRFSSAVVRFSMEAEGRRWREELNVCRELRNMLSHHAQIGGEDIFQPSDSVVDVMREILDSVKNPPVAVKAMTPFDALMKCSMTDHVIWLIRRMNAQGFSHVPIVSSGYLVGVFSTATVFSYLEKYGEKSITGETEISEFSEFLPVEAHITESYRFCAPDASYYNIKKFFEATSPDRRRVVAVFVTRDGTENSKLLGIITPWDMLRCFPE